MRQYCIEGDKTVTGEIGDPVIWSGGELDDIKFSGAVDGEKGMMCGAGFVQISSSQDLANPSFYFCRPRDLVSALPINQPAIALGDDNQAGTRMIHCVVHRLL